jgi:hypothetical protein
LERCAILLGSSGKSELDDWLTGGDQLTKAASADTIHEGRGLDEIQPARWVSEVEVFTWSERRWTRSHLAHSSGRRGCPSVTSGSGGMSGSLLGWEKTEHGVRRVGPRPATVIYCGWRRAATRRASLDSAMARGSDMDSSGGPGPINNARSFI